jgi:hypothetical protein
MAIKSASSGFRILRGGRKRYSPLWFDTKAVKGEFGSVVREIVGEKN